MGHGKKPIGDARMCRPAEARGQQEMTLLIAIGAIPLLFAGLLGVCACLSGCCCADRAALLAVDGPAQAEFTSSVPSVKVS